MTKHASTSNCVGKDGGGGCGGVPSLSPLPCSLPSLCTQSLPSSLPLLPLSPWRRPRAAVAAAANDDSSEYGAPPQPLPPNVGGGSARVAARRRCPLQPIPTASPRRIRIILASAAAAVLSPHPHLPLPPATTGSVAVDVYKQD
jgi:hypothetical protein